MEYNTIQIGTNMEGFFKFYYSFSHPWLHCKITTYCNPLFFDHVDYGPLPDKEKAETAVGTL